MKENIIYKLMFSLIVGVVGWIWLFSIDPKIAIAIFLIILSNNIAQNYK